MIICKFQPWGQHTYETPAELYIYIYIYRYTVYFVKEYRYNVHFLHLETVHACSVTSVVSDSL